jgi:hypothetical protein
MSMFTRNRTRQDERHHADAAIECSHRTLLPRWDKAEDMGHEDLATAYQCASCNQIFSPGDAAMLRQAATDRLQHLDAA